MKKAIGKVFGVLGTIAGWCFLAVRVVLELIGYATINDDAQAAQGLLRDFFIWTLSLPWWAPLVFASFITIVVLWFLVGPPTLHKINNGVAYKSKIAEYSHQSAPLMPESVFVGWINISTRDFRGELLVISFYAFNASGHTIDIASVSGVIGIEFIDCARGGLLLSKALLQSSPRLVNERCDVNSIKTLKSFKFTIEQHIMPELMDEISKTSNMRRMRLNFDLLNVTACRSDDKNETVRVPLWRRADFRKSSGEGVTTWVEAVTPQEQPLSEI